MLENEGRLRFLRRSTDPRRNRLRRGVYLLPSLLTMGNMFCGYACVVYAMRGEYATAAPFIGFAVVLDMLDGRIARMTNTASEFGVEFDSMADIISFGIAPAILSFSWGLQALGRLGWAAGFMFVAAAAMRLARFNIQSGSGGDTSKRMRDVSEEMRNAASDLRRHREHHAGVRPGRHEEVAPRDEARRLEVERVAVGRDRRMRLALIRERRADQHRHREPGVACRPGRRRCACRRSAGLHGA